MRDGTGRLHRVLVMGGTSEIGLATVRALDLDEDAEVVLAGRDRNRLEEAAAGLPSRLRTDVRLFDATDPESALVVVRSVFAEGDVDLVLPAFGVLGDQAGSERDVESVLPQIQVNVTSQAVVLLEAARLLREQGHGTLCVLSSIAAARSRRANFVYGATKAAVDALGTGLALAVEGSGARVIVVRPGFVIGRMTAGMPAAPFASTPEEVGAAVARAVRSSGRRVVWVPRELGVVAAAMRLAPYSVWRRVRR
jgi:decaprenylphospho-beta-D-erythro-pentofuranosid-2-ulose 2-reductase